MSQPLRIQVGSLFIVGLEGFALSKFESSWLRLLQPAGVILFRRNISDAVQAHALLTWSAECLNEVAFRCIDLEGGTVDRLRDAFAPMPAAATVAATGRKRDARLHGELIAAEARAAGFNVVLAPVLDLALAASREVMTTRVAAPDANGVIAYAKPFLKALAANEIMGCGKHFPGLGGGALDSHAAMPRIGRTWNQLWQEDIAPYRALKAELPMVMISHAAYPRVPGAGEQPASLSRFWIESVLRKRIGYRGLVFSDDLEMGGVLAQSRIEEACVGAIMSGCDLLEICHQPDLILRGYEATLREAERSPAFRRRVLLAASRVAAAKRIHLRSAALGAPPDRVTVANLKERVARFSSMIAKAQPQ